MTRQFAHPSGKRLLGEVRDLFLKKDIFFSLAPHIVFVCGGTKRSAFRSRFLTYLGKKSPKVQPFLAEKAVKNLRGRETAAVEGR